MSMRAQRRHAGGIVAQVEQQGVWRGSAWVVSDRVNSARHVDHPLPFMQSAQAAADALAREISHHVCTEDECGEWVAWLVED
jgi:hypothetical protein